jgi:hypothetical protein
MGVRHGSDRPRPAAHAARPPGGVDANDPALGF